MPLWAQRYVREILVPDGEFWRRLKSGTYFVHKEALFNKNFTLQYHGIGYILAIISLVAIYAGLDSYNANSINFILFIYGGLFTACMIITDLYKRLYLSNNVVKGLYEKLTTRM